MSFNIGLSGLYAANKQLDVTGNNIANVATTGFKASRVEFQDQYAQSIRGTSGNSNNGSGVAVGAVAQQFKQGDMQTGTGNSLDLAINGNGFFEISNNGERLYTRAGAFHTDKDGFVVNNSGMNLQGYNIDANGVVVVGSLTNLRVDSTALPPSATTTMTHSGNLNSATSSPSVLAFDPTNTQTYNSKMDSRIYDTQGNLHQLQVYYVKEPTPVNTWSMYTLIDGRSIADSSETPPVADKVTLTFDSSGKLTDAVGSTNLVANLDDNGDFDGSFTVDNWVPGIQTGTDPVTWAPNGADAAVDGTRLDLATLTQTASVTSTGYKQNGYATGQISAMNVDASGNMFATYTNGQSKVIGQVALTSFTNVQGLASAGGTNWRETFASGEPVSGVPQSGTLGNITGQALEESNVDLTMELVELIKAQSNYQANAKTISTQSTLMQTTIQMA